MPTPTGQPVWELVANLGDRSPFEHGGYFVFRDTTGEYPEEAALLTVEDEEAESPRYTVHRFVLDRLKKAGPYLVPFAYEEGWPHPVERYDEWFHRDLDRASESVGISHGELEDAFTSADPIVRAGAYRAVGDYHGWENLDSYPSTGLTREEAKAMFRGARPPHDHGGRSPKDWDPRRGKGER